MENKSSSVGVEESGLFVGFLSMIIRRNVGQNGVDQFLARSGGFVEV